MHNVSNAYKRAMEKPLRDRGYIQVGLGACKDTNEVISK